MIYNFKSVYSHSVPYLYKYYLVPISSNILYYSFGLLLIPIIKKKQWRNKECISRSFFFSYRCNLILQKAKKVNLNSTILDIVIISFYQQQVISVQMCVKKTEPAKWNIGIAILCKGDRDDSNKKDKKQWSEMNG